MVKRNMDRNTALDILGLSDATSSQEVRDQYRRLCRIGHPDSPNFGGIVKNIAELKEAYEFLMDNTKKRWPKHTFGDSGFDNRGYDIVRRFGRIISDWLEEWVANEQGKRLLLANLLKQYELRDTINDNDPLIVLLAKELNDSFLEALYLQKDSSSLDEKF